MRRFYDDALYKSTFYLLTYLLTYIIFCSCGYFLLLLFFPRLFSAVENWMSTILLHMMWPEMCCTWLAGNAGPKKSPKYAIWAPSHNFVGLCFATKACIDNRKKLVKQQCLLYVS